MAIPRDSNASKVRLGDGVLHKGLILRVRLNWETACREAGPNIRTDSRRCDSGGDIHCGGRREHHADRRFTSVLQVSMATSKDSVKPVHVFRLRGITASVFANVAETKNGDITFHKVSIQRTYKDGKEFKSTTSFGRDDLPIVRLLSDRAWQFILDTEAKRGRDDDAE